MPKFKQIMNSLPNVRRSRELVLIRAHLRELCRSTAPASELLETLIHSCDEFMCWAEEVKQELMDQRDQMLTPEPTECKPRLRLRAE